MAWYAYVNVNHAYLYNWSAPSYYLTTVIQNDCYSEVTAYTALGYSYWDSFHDTYGWLRHAHWQYRLQLPYKLLNQSYGVYISSSHTTSY